MAPKNKLQQYLEHKAIRQLDRQQATDEKDRLRASAKQNATEGQEIINAYIVATFIRRAIQVAIATCANTEQTREAEEKAMAELEASKGPHQQNSREINLSDLGWPHHGCIDYQKYRSTMHRLFGPRIMMHRLSGPRINDAWII
jgi:hypothetical protein